MTPREAVPSRAADWVEENYKLQLNEFQRKAVRLLCRGMRCGPYDLDRTFKTAEWGGDHYARFVVYARGGRLCTIDGDGLTRLVIGAHEEMIRVDVSPHTFHHLEIMMHQRHSRESGIGVRHPTIEQAVDSYRSLTGMY